MHACDESRTSLSHHTKDLSRTRFVVFNQGIYYCIFLLLVQP